MNIDIQIDVILLLNLAYSSAGEASTDFMFQVFFVILCVTVTFGYTPLV